MTIDQFLEDLKLLPQLQEMFMGVSEEIEKTQHYQFYKGLLHEGGREKIEFAAMQIAAMFYLVGFYGTPCQPNKKGQ